MLNEAMDEVVLVKGWKKNANWSFPRGKINKDERDIDCAIREVYEETGYDIKASGLAAEDENTKSIEVTMREQHMRLYVFRGVPEDTHFEPRTRKEISKIQWYKLSELPTLKKSKQQQQEGRGEDLVVNANKFYMVAPFLNPLKKWISQQKKQDAINGPRHVRQVSPQSIEYAIVEEMPVVNKETEVELEHGQHQPFVDAASPVGSSVEREQFTGGHCSSGNHEPCNQPAQKSSQRSRNLVHVTACARISSQEQEKGQCNAFTSTFGFPRTIDSSGSSILGTPNTA